MHLAPRCLAQTRRGTLCQSPGMTNGRCRMHGGPSPGPPKGNRNAWAIIQRKQLRIVELSQSSSGEPGSYSRFSLPQAPRLSAREHRSGACADGTPWDRGLAKLHVVGILHPGQGGGEDGGWE
ncbi:MAG: HGGxSTG domain-containing protein [Xanthobacteraceae bacterium]